MHGRRVAVVACEFRFLAGSIGVASAERLTRAIERATAERLPLLAAPGLRRHPDAGGHPRVRADGEDLRGDRGAQEGRAALPRLPAAPHDRRRDGLVGVARARDRGRARGAGRVPRTAGLRGALRQAVPRGRADLGEPLRPRPRRRRGAARPGRRDPGPGAQRAHRAQRGAGRRTQPAGRRGRRRGHLGVRHPVAAAGAARRTAPAEVRRHRRDPAQRHRAGRVRPGAADRARAVRRLALHLPRPGPARADQGAPARARARCGRPGAGCGSRPSCTCR